jgi:hypothetical protein
MWPAVLELAFTGKGLLESWDCQSSNSAIIVPYLKDNPSIEASADTFSGWPKNTYKIIYGKVTFDKLIPDLTEEELIKLLTTGKPTTLILHTKEDTKGAAEAYDNQ